MGKTMMGGATHEKNISMLTPEQEGLLSQTLSQLGPNATGTLGQFLQPQTPESYQDAFQKAYVDPAMLAFNKSVVPGIQQRFADMNAGSSSALNNALAQSAADLSTSIGSQFGQFMQGQQQNQLGALSQFLPLMLNQTFSPLISKQEGLAGPIIEALGRIGAGAASHSSRTVKENIREYSKALDDIKKLEVKQYDYIEEVGGLKDRVGVIAEDIPEELTLVKNGHLHVDLYGLIGLLINSVKELLERVQTLEEAL